MKKGILCCLVIVCVMAGLYAFSQSQDRQITKQQTTSTSSLDEVNTQKIIQILKRILKNHIKS